jgi:hypothetical protein
MAFQDILYDHPASFGHLGLRFQRLSYGSIAAYDSAGAATGQTSASDMLVGLSYSRPIREWGLSVGASAKFAQETLSGVSARAYLGDVGLSYAPRVGGWLGQSTFGLALRNLGPATTFDTVASPAPSEAVAGFSTPLYADRVVLAADLHAPRQQAAFGSFGMELWGLDTVALRLGAQAPQDQGPNVRAGVGLRLGSFQLDYAFFPMGELGQTHHVSLRFVFGGPAEKLYNEGLKLMRQEKYPQAVMRFNDVLKLDAKHWRAVRKLRRAYELMQREEAK